MRRREFIALMSASVTWPFAAIAQEAGRTYHCGIVAPFPCEGAPVLIALSEEMRRRGFINGQNLAIDCHEFGPNINLTEYAGELVKAKVDVIIAYGDIGIRAAQQATKTIPILAMTDDMLGSGLVNSQARPNGNTTGVSILASELDGKRQELLIEAVPGLRRMAALADPNMPHVMKLDALEEAARERNIELSIHRVARAEEIPAAIKTAQTSGATALNVLASPMLWANRQLIMDHVVALRLPAMYEWPEMAEEGGFAAYGPRATQVSRDITARQLVQLFHGTKVADIPVEQPTYFELLINLKTANAMGVKVPPAFLARADKVIE
jgi:putative ABC transport system substrate-binding protein